MKDFREHLKDPEPGFRCYAAGRKDEEIGFSIKVHHKLNRKATADGLAKLEKLLGKSGQQVRDLYALHNGMSLYCQNDSPAMEFYRISEWEAKNKLWKEAWEGALSDDDLYEFQYLGVAFGEPSGSGNYFVFHKGAVYYWDHDGGDDTPLAGSFFEFLSRIAREPAKFLQELGCYARYSDAKTNSQWIPKEYWPNLEHAPPFTPSPPQAAMENWLIDVIFSSGRKIRLKEESLRLDTCKRFDFEHELVTDYIGWWVHRYRDPKYRNEVIMTKAYDAPMTNYSHALARITEIRFRQVIGKTTKQRFTMRGADIRAVAAKPISRKLAMFILKAIQHRLRKQAKGK